MGKLIALMIVIAGCGSTATAPAPAAQDVERALVAAWENSGYMPREDRPTVRWLDNSACGFDRALASATMQHATRCSEHTLDLETGALAVGWHPGQKLSDTGLGLGLAEWKLWLWTSSEKDQKLMNEYTVEFDAAIASAGL